MVLPPELIEWAVGVVASVITQGLRLLADRWGYSPNRAVVNVGLLAVSLGMFGLFFGFPDAPVPGENLVDYSIALLDGAKAVLGSAAFLYNTLLDKVLKQPGE